MKRWSEQYEYTRTVDNPYMDNLIEYLSNNIPAEDETACAIVHGDFKFDKLAVGSGAYQLNVSSSDHGQASVSCDIADESVCLGTVALTG